MKEKRKSKRRGNRGVFIQWRDQSDHYEKEGAGLYEGFYCGGTPERGVQEKGLADGVGGWGAKWVGLSVRCWASWN